MKTDSALQIATPFALEGAIVNEQVVFFALLYYTLKSQSLFRELQLILDILSCVERGRIAKGVICHVYCAVA